MYYQSSILFLTLLGANTVHGKYVGAKSRQKWQNKMLKLRVFVIHPK